MILERCLLVLSLTATIACVAITRFGAADWPTYVRLTQERDSVVADNARLCSEVSKTRRAILALRERPAIQEGVVRTALGYVRPGDIVYRLAEGVDAGALDAPEQAPQPPTASLGLRRARK